MVPRICYLTHPLPRRDQAMESRLTELECKLSFTEDLLDEVNHTVYRQQQQIDRLEQELRWLRQQLLASLPGEPRNLRDEIPPHY